MDTTSTEYPGTVVMEKTSTEYGTEMPTAKLMEELWNSSESTYQAGTLDIPLWITVIHQLQFTCTTLGFITNVVTMVTIMRNGQEFTRPTRIVFIQQSFADALVCLIASVVILQPFMWLTGYYNLDIILCYVWHGQALYWGCVTLSTYNLVLISYERYLSVCKPFKYAMLSETSRKKTALQFLALIIISVLVTHGTYIQTRLENGQCVNKYAWDGQAMESYFFFFVIFTYLITYFLPLVIMALFYGLVAYKLRKRRDNVALGQSRVLDRASADLTKTAIVVSIIFAISIGYDLHYYLLGHTGVVTYELNTLIQKVGVFLSNLNSTANPLVYALLMPVYRRSLMTTLSCKKQKDQNNKSIAGSSQQSLNSNVYTVSEGLQDTT